MSTAKGLGKGFDILMPISVNVSNVAASAGERVHRLSVDTVVPKQDQPRQHFDDLALNQLAHSISEHGILQPLVVVQLEQNKYSIIAGERRWRAAKLAGLTEVPVIIRSADEHEQLELALLENVQRADLSALETAITIHRLHTQFNQSYESIASRLGKAYTTVINSTRLLSLPETMQQSLAVGTITEGHARALLSLRNYPDQQEKLFINIVAKGLNVRQAEQFAIVVKRGTNKKDLVAKKIQPALSTTTKAIEKHLGAKVTLQHSIKGRGKLVISYGSEQELERITKQLLQR